jgi:hypothetical protein
MGFFTGRNYITGVGTRDWWLGIRDSGFARTKLSHNGPESLHERHAFALGEDSGWPEPGAFQFAEQRRRFGRRSGMGGCEPEASGDAKRRGPDDQDPPAGPDDPKQFGQSTPAFGNVPPKEGISIHDADIETPVFERPDRSFGHEDLDEHALRRRGRLEGPGRVRRVHDGAGPSRETSLAGELREELWQPKSGLENPFTKPQTGHVHGQLNRPPRATQAKQ